jgi:hypothetical protein
MHAQVTAGWLAMLGWESVHMRRHGQCAVPERYARAQSEFLMHEHLQENACPTKASVYPEAKRGTAQHDHHLQLRPTDTHSLNPPHTHAQHTHA